MELFRDTFEGTDFDMVKDLTVTDEDGKTVKSPLANPFMPYEMNKMLKINGGWGWRGERSLARWYCMYVHVTQSRSWLPDPVGGLVWFGYSNPAMTTYVPLYAGVTDLPRDYQTDGRTTGFSRRSAWWAFNRVATLSAHRWGEMRRGRGGGSRSAPGEVSIRPDRGRRDGRWAAGRGPRSSAGIAHETDRGSVHRDHPGVLEPRRPALDQIR